MTDLLPPTVAPDRTSLVLGDDSGPVLSDEELTAQALGAPAVTDADADAVNYWDVVAPRSAGLLPEWYMPSPSAGARRLTGWRRSVVWLVVLAIGLINAAGLCITYGRVTLG